MRLSPTQLNHFWPYLLSASLALLVLSVLGSLIFGAAAITLQQLGLWLLGQGDAQTQLIVGSLRLPRALLAAIVGALLGICGAASQGLFRNPLADPSLIGVTAGASAGASVVIVCLNFSHWGLWGLSVISLGAFTGAIAVVLCVYRLATGAQGTSVATMLLAGVAFSYLAGSLTGVLEFVADNQRLRQMSLWRMGGLDGANAVTVSLIAVVLVIVSTLLYTQHRALNALLLGESEARYLGIAVDRVKRRIVVCIAAGVGVSVALAGSIAFVGLVVPHMVRAFLGPNHRYLLPMSACFGAILLVAADGLARTLIAPTELPVGLLTACLGAPVFILLLHRHQKMREI
jgi:iron complex transport system permease protein